MNEDILNIVIMGPPGSGKGTQSVRLATRLGLPHLSTGELLRAEIASGSDFGRRVEEAVTSGSLVPDEWITDIVLARITSRDGVGYLLDGFPRSTSQARSLLDSPVPPGKVVVLEVAEEELLRRMSARADAEGRSDDTAEVIAHRLTVYRESALPVVELFSSLGRVIRIDAQREPDVVEADIMAAVRDC